MLLCHGFTGSPQTLRGWADYLAAQDLTVSLPRLPGHGTTWQDLARTGSDDWFAEVDAAFGKLALGHAVTVRAAPRSGKLLSLVALVSLTRRAAGVHCAADGPGWRPARQTGRAGRRAEPSTRSCRSSAPGRGS